MLPTAPTDAADVNSSSPNFVAGLRQNAWSILLVTALVTLVAVGVSKLQPPRYTSDASVVLQDSGDTGTSPNMATEKQIASSSAVAALVIQSLHLHATPQEVSWGLSVSVPVDASVLDFSYTSGDPKDAQRRAQAFADAYLSYRHDALVRAAQSANDLADIRITELENELRAVTQKQQTAKTHSKLEAYRVRANALFAQIGVEEQRAAAATGSLGTVGDRLVAATLPMGPSQPKVVLNGLLGMFFGLSLGTFVALWHASFKRRVQTEEDVRDMLKMPLLAVIPERGRGSRSFSILSGEISHTAGAYRGVVVKLLSSGVFSTNGHRPEGFQASAGPARTIAVVPLDAKAAATEIAANVAAAVAMSGRSVLHVSTTGMEETVEFLPRDEAPGLADVMRGHADLADALRPTPIDGLRALPPGHGDGSWLLLDARRVQAAITGAAALADVVIIPAPSSGRDGVEATAVVAAADAVLYVGALGSTNLAEANRVRAGLEPLGKPTLGAVMLERAHSARRQHHRTSGTRRRSASKRRHDAPRGAVGNPPRWKATRHVVRSRISEHPRVYLPLARRRYPGPSPKVVSDDTELVIDGYTRSASTFAVYAFQIAQQQSQQHHSRRTSANGTGRTHPPVRIAHHVHAPAQLLEAARRGIPTIVVIREPEGAILSQLLQEPNVSMRDALVSYERFYSTLIPHSLCFVSGEFREVTTDFGAVIRRLNKRFHTHYRTFDPTQENTRLCLDLMKERPTTDQEWRKVVLGFESGTVPLGELLARLPKRNGDAPAVTDTWVPSTDREQAKDALRERWNAPELSPLRERAHATYREFLRLTAVGEDG